jgi:hypothetical protein
VVTIRRISLIDTSGARSQNRTFVGQTHNVRIAKRVEEWNDAILYATGRPLEGEEIGPSSSDGIEWSYLACADCSGFLSGTNCQACNCFTGPDHQAQQLILMLRRQNVHAFSAARIVPKQQLHDRLIRESPFRQVQVFLYLLPLSSASIAHHTAEHASHFQSAQPLYAPHPSFFILLFLLISVEKLI